MHWIRTKPIVWFSHLSLSVALPETHRPLCLTLFLSLSSLGLYFDRFNGTIRYFLKILSLENQTPCFSIIKITLRAYVFIFVLYRQIWLLRFERDGFLISVKTGLWWVKLDESFIWFHAFLTNHLSVLFYPPHIWFMFLFWPNKIVLLGFKSCVL